MESADSVQGLLALGESLPKRPRSEEVVFEEEDLGSGEFELIYERIDVLLQQNEDMFEENNRLVRLIQAQECRLRELQQKFETVSANQCSRMTKMQWQLEEVMRRVVSIEHPE